MAVTDNQPAQQQQSTGVAPAMAAAAATVLPPAAAGALTVTAIVAMSTKLLTAFRGFQQQREHAFEQQIRVDARQLQPDMAQTVLDGVITRELGYDITFQANQYDRVQTALPTVLAIQDPVARQAAIQKLLDAERRYTVAHEQAVRDRVFAGLRNYHIQQVSPRGAVWHLGKAVNHTPICEFLAGRAWPWSLINRLNGPPLHHGCACFLTPVGDDEAVPDDNTALQTYLNGTRNLEEARYEDRWQAGVQHGGEFRPRAGGNPGSMLLRKLGLLGRGQKRHLEGEEHVVPRDDDWSRTINNHAFHSPAGTTNVYRDGMLIADPGESSHVRHAINILRASNQHDLFQRGGAPLRPGDSPEAVVTMGDRGYLQTGMRSAGSKRWQGKWRHHDSGATASAIIDKNGVLAADFTTVPEPSVREQKILRPARNWREHVRDTHAWHRELAAKYGTPSHIGKILSDDTFEDHAGFHEWDGTIHLGRDVQPDIERAAHTRSQKLKLSDDELRGVYSSHWATAHELAHGINLIQPYEYQAENGLLEEALTEEMSHPLAVQHLLKQGQGDVVAWARANPNNPAVRGAYLRERGALANILDNLPEDQRAQTVEDLKFRIPASQRFDRLGQILKIKNPELTDSEAEYQARDIIQTGATGRPVLGMASPGSKWKGQGSLWGGSHGHHTTTSEYGQYGGYSSWTPPPVTIGGINPEPPAVQGDIPDYDHHTFKLAQKRFGTEARHATDENKDDWLVDQTKGRADYAAAQLLANAIYRHLGVPAPEAGRVTTPGSPDFSTVPDSLTTEPPLPTDHWRVSTGVVLRDKKGRVTLIKPRNNYGSYRYTFPKGGMEKGLSPQQNALKELWEETGLHGHITGIVGDFKGDMSTTRYYEGVRTGGVETPSSETEAIETVTPKLARDMLVRLTGQPTERDQHVMDKLDEMPAPSGKKFPDLFPPILPGVAIAIPKIGKSKNSPDIQPLADHLAADALLGNWDVAGGSFGDNLHWDKNGNPIRLQNPSALEFDKEGHLKPFGPVPDEMWSFQHKGPLAGKVEASDEQLRQQAAHIADSLSEADIDRMVDAAPFRDKDMRDRVRENLKLRTNWMRDYANHLVDLPAPPDGHEAAAIHEAGSAVSPYPEEQQALAEYLHDPSEVNTYILEKKGKPSDDVDRIVKHLDHLLDDTGTSEDTYAYIPLVEPPGKSHDTITINGYPRLTTDEGAAQLASDTVMKVLMPEGTHSMYLPDESRNILLPRNSRFKINKHRDQDGRTYIDAVLQPYWKPGALYTTYTYGGYGGSYKPKEPVDWKTGDRVYHSFHGVGTVVKPASESGLVQVQFDEHEKGNTRHVFGDLLDPEHKKSKAGAFEKGDKVMLNGMSGTITGLPSKKQVNVKMDKDGKSYTVPPDAIEHAKPHLKTGDWIHYGMLASPVKVVATSRKEGKLVAATIKMPGGKEIKLDTPEKLGRLDLFETSDFDAEMDYLGPVGWDSDEVLEGELSDEESDFVEDWETDTANPDDDPLNENYGGGMWSPGTIDEVWSDAARAAAIAKRRERDPGDLPEQAWHEPPVPWGRTGQHKAGGFTAIGVKNTRFGDAVEEALQKHLGMSNEHPDRRQGPLDLRYGHHGYELKAVTQAATEYKSKPKKHEVDEKRAYAAEHGLTPHTMIGVYSPDEKAVHVYSHEGIGAFRLTDQAHGWHYHGHVPVDLGEHPDPVAHPEHIPQTSVSEDWAKWDAEHDLGVTPFEDAHDKQEGFYDSPKAHQFEQDARDFAEQEGMHFGSLDRVRGVWNGGGEPSYALHVQDGEPAAQRLMDRLGGKYSQEGVVRFSHDPAGTSTRYVSKDTLTRDEALRRVSEAGLPGATHRPDGKLEVIDINDENPEAAHKAFEGLPGEVTHETGNAELRFGGEHYETRRSQGRSWDSPDEPGEAGSTAVSESAVPSDDSGRSGVDGTGHAHADPHSPEVELIESWAKYDAERRAKAMNRIRALGVDVSEPDDRQSTLNDVRAEHVANVLETAFKQYPILHDGEYPLKNVIFDSGLAEGDEARNDEGSGAAVSVPTPYEPMYLTINDHDSALLDHFQEGAKEGFVNHAIGDAPTDDDRMDGIIWHEIGHALMGAAGNDTFRLPTEGRELLTAEMLKRHGLTFSDLSKLSGYAASAPTEAIGELSSMWHTPGAKAKLEPALRAKAEAFFDGFKTGKNTNELRIIFKEITGNELPA